MPVMSEFVEYLQEVFERFGPIRARRMFGGWGIYHNDFMFALVEKDILYLKADDQSAQFFKDRGLGQFQYVNKGKTISMSSYYLAPEEIFDDPEAARAWAARAYEAAVRSRKALPAGRKKK
jgi:DNA transformation protein